MPIYEYRCETCDTTFEIFHGMKENQKEQCGNCAGNLKRVYNSTPVHFKGQGFYSTDYNKLSNQGKDDYEKRKADEYDKKYEAKDKKLREERRDRYKG
jgi:putative FmdB family regulatory protein